MMLASGALFAFDLMGYFNVAQVAIADLKEAKGSVSRLESEEWSWDRAQVGTRFSARDAIATGEASFARIRFKEGADLVLNPGSMVLLNTQVNEISLRFLTGSGHVRVAKSATKKFIASKGPVPKIAKIEKTETAQVPAPVTQPVEHIVPIEEVETLEATPQETAATTPVLKEISQPLAPVISQAEIRNPEAALKSQQEITKVEELVVAPEIVSPLDASHFELTEQKEIVLRWKGDSKNLGKYEITLVPQAPDGKAPAKRFRADKEEYALKGIEPGKYDWSVRAIDTQAGRSPVSAHHWFTVSRAELPAAEVVVPVKKVPGKVGILPVQVE